MADSDRWADVNRRGKGAGGVLHITWICAPADQTLKTRVERALFNGAKAAGFTGVVRVDGCTDGETVRVCHVEDEDGDQRPHDVAEGWLGVARIATR